ncbi:hypothetical protein [Streptomyces sp. NPDC101393]|uniref:hypothetical protein n=1 Tax=Streptomyces sp. NPDC101393 TaxID=3366141 RepID=UPI003827D1C0
MTDLEFYVQAAIRAEVAGAALGADALQWAEAIGDDCVEDVRRSRMRRDYGLIEIFFERRTGTWQSTGFSLQVHRLGLGKDMVPAALSSRYGDFRKRVEFESLCESILHTGNDIEELERVGAHRHYKLPRSNVSIYVVGESDPALPVAYGDVWSINAMPTP